MGAMDFTTRADGKTAKEAFKSAVDDACWEYGHGGYTGTIAEKAGFEMVEPINGESVRDCIERCMNDDDHFCQDKWGPAACVKSDKEDEWIFFGWASS